MIKAVLCKHLTRPLRLCSLHYLRSGALANNTSFLIVKQCSSFIGNGLQNSLESVIGPDGKQKLSYNNSKSKQKKIHQLSSSSRTNEETMTQERNDITNSSTNDIVNGEKETFIRQLKMENPHNSNDIVKEMYYGSIKFDINQNTRTKNKNHNIDQSELHPTPQMKRKYLNKEKIIPTVKQSNFFEENYFSDHNLSHNLTKTDGIYKNIHTEKIKVNNLDQTKSNVSRSKEESPEDLNFFDETLFSDYNISNKNSCTPANNIKIDDINTSSSKERHNISKSKDESPEDLNFFDETLLSDYNVTNKNSFTPRANFKIEDIYASSSKECHGQQGPILEEVTRNRKSGKYFGPVEISDKNYPNKDGVTKDNLQISNSSEVVLKNSNEDGLTKYESDGLNYFDEILFGCNTQSNRTKIRTRHESNAEQEMSQSDNKRAHNEETAYDYVMAKKKKVPTATLR